MLSGSMPETFYEELFVIPNFKWELITQFNKPLDFDAMTLGKHEFDDGMEWIHTFMKNTTCPIFSCCQLECYENRLKIFTVLQLSYILEERKFVWLAT